MCSPADGFFLILVVIFHDLGPFFFLFRAEVRQFSLLTGRVFPFFFFWVGHSFRACSQKTPFCRRQGLFSFFFPRYSSFFPFFRSRPLSCQPLVLSLSVVDSNF